jgi:drug/metabolite transporter (DMT)-like permease
LTASIKDYFHLHFLIVLWGFTAILGLLIKIPPIELVLFRTSIATIGLFLLLRALRTKVLIDKKGMIKMLGTGLVISAHWILFFASARASTASVCLAGMATTSLWTSLIEPMVNRQRVRFMELFFGLIVIFGLYLIFHFEFNHAIGLILALISAILAAVFTVINSKFTHHYNHYLITFWEMMGAAIGTAIFMPFYALLFLKGTPLNLHPDLFDWMYLIILALVCTVYPFSVSVELMKRISAFATNLSLNMEPVYGIILAVLIFGDKEKMNPGFYLGTMVILLSVILYPIIRRLNRRKPLERSIS